MALVRFCGNTRQSQWNMVLACFSNSKQRKISTHKIHLCKGFWFYQDISHGTLKHTHVCSKYKIKDVFFECFLWECGSFRSVWVVTQWFACSTFYRRCVMQWDSYWSDLGLDSVSTPQSPGLVSVSIHSGLGHDLVSVYLVFGVHLTVLKYWYYLVYNVL